MRQTETIGEAFARLQHETKAEVAVKAILEFIGEDPTREGLVETPQRVRKAWAEITSGYQISPEEILKKRFKEKSDDMVVLSGIKFYSTCEHHLLPFMGEAAVAYLPSEHVVGISKLARLVECFGRRLQIQERMTGQIAEAIQTHLSPRGVGVIISAHHMCMGCRGVRQSNTVMTTSALLGEFREPEVRAEFLKLVEGGKR